MRAETESAVKIPLHKPADWKTERMNRVLESIIGPCFPRSGPPSCRQALSPEGNSAGQANFLQMRSLLLICLLVTTIIGTARSETWSNKGVTWTCSSGISLKFPQRFKVGRGALDSISVEQDGFSLTFIPAQGADKREQGIAGLMSMFTKQHVEFPTTWEQRKHSPPVTVFIKRAAFDSKVSRKGSGVVAVVDKGQAHLVIMMLLPEILTAELQAEIDSVLDSTR